MYGPCVTTGDQEGTRRRPVGTQRRLRRRWPTAATGTAKTLFAVCQKSGTWQTYSPCVSIGTQRKKASRRRHGQLTALAAVRRVPAPWTHGEHPGFAVCPNGRHTAKLPASPCAAPGAHGEVWSLCRVLRFGTRQSLLPGRPIRSLCHVPWPRHTVKRPKKPCFFVF